MSARDGAVSVTDKHGRGRCPKCHSPSPRLHPAVQFEGEVEVCRHPFHEEKAK
jgi:hypothetical protein